MRAALFVVAIAGALAACSAFTSSSSEPADADAGASVDAGGSDASSDAVAEPDAPPPGDGGTTDAAPLSPAKKAFVTTVYPSIEMHCAACHVTGADAGGGAFFGTDGPSTYLLFKQFGFIVKPASSNPFVTKGAHAGPPLTNTEVTAIDAWLALEP